ncbi:MULTISPECIES: hypothetical protein [unclassified Bradyrhizobium]|uniref:hypothetical protein n=1 Tax=unclassified Bradyrhizobium TaxID=2631580 RepID=UPI00291625D1|nr:MULTISPECIES: hypothetical protein [unclassified Bradyrhizobium]
MVSENLTPAAVIALSLWLPISIFIFAYCRAPSIALIAIFLSAQLLLPANTNIKFPMLPPIDKASIASFGALGGCLLFARRPLFRKRFEFGFPEILVLLLVAGPIVTSELNTDAILVGDRFLPGVGIYDAMSAAEAALIALLPFFLGRRLLRNPEDLTAILRTITIAGMIYCIPLLFEVRFSPQLHYWVYGYYPSDFVQAVREGGFRPMVFMGHGLLAAFFIMMSFLAAISLWRRKMSIWSLPPVTPAAILTLMLLVFKSLGALLYGMSGGMIVLFRKPKTIFSASLVLVAISITYPLLRATGLVPTGEIISFIEQINSERAQSLDFRFRNEDRLLARAFERPFFGWGRYGRSRIYEYGNDTSVTDGRWIIDLGQFGLIGFLGEFGLLALCVWRSASTWRYANSSGERLSLATLTLIIAINMFDLLPNASLIPLTWLLAGSLLGQAERLVTARKTFRRTQVANTGGIQTLDPLGAPVPRRYLERQYELNSGHA